MKLKTAEMKLESAELKDRVAKLEAGSKRMRMSWWKGLRVDDVDDKLFRSHCHPAILPIGLLCTRSMAVIV